MLLREQYQEHSERDYLSVPLATYHFEQVTIPLHWHREVELILPQEAGELELEGQLHPYGPQELLGAHPPGGPAGGGLGLAALPPAAA